MVATRPTRKIPNFQQFQQNRRGFVSIGCDCAGEGRDKFIFSAIDESGIIELVETTKADTQTQFSIVRELVHKYDALQIVNYYRIYRYEAWK